MKGLNLRQCGLNSWALVRLWYVVGFEGVLYAVKGMCREGNVRRRVAAELIVCLSGARLGGAVNNNARCDGLTSPGRFWELEESR